MSKAASNLEYIVPVERTDWKRLYDRPVKIQLFSERVPDWLKKAKDPGVLLIEHPNLQLCFSGR
jgi:hypothetical protein